MYKYQSPDKETQELWPRLEAPFFGLLTTTGFIGVDDTNTPLFNYRWIDPAMAYQLRTTPDIQDRLGSYLQDRFNLTLDDIMPGEAVEAALGIDLSSKPTLSRKEKARYTDQRTAMVRVAGLTGFLGVDNEGAPVTSTQLFSPQYHMHLYFPDVRQWIDSHLSQYGIALDQLWTPTPTVTSRLMDLRGEPVPPGAGQVL